MIEPTPELLTPAEWKAGIGKAGGKHPRSKSSMIGSVRPPYPQIVVAHPNSGKRVRERATFPTMLLLALLTLPACAPPPYVPADTSAASDTGTVADEGLGISIAWPANEVAVTGCVTVVVEYSGLTLTDPMVNPEPTEGQGHYHILFADKYALCAAPYCLVNFDTDEDTATTGVTGEVVLTAQLMDNAHQPLLNDEGAEVSDTLFVNVTAGECAEGSGSAY